MLYEFAKQFLNTSPVEWLGVITGFLCVYLAARQNLWNWPVSIVSVSVYAWLFYHHKLYGDAVLQFYFLFTAVYGWYYWLKRPGQHVVPVVSLYRTDYLKLILCTGCLAAGLGYFLHSVTNSDVPYIDGTCTAISFVAQFLMTRKVLQNWLLWIVVDAAYIPLYLYKTLTLTAVLYLVFLIIAIMGYRDWRKAYKVQLKTQS